MISSVWTEAGRTVVTGMSVIRLCVYRETVLLSESKERLAKVCVLRQRIRRMQSY